MEQSRSWNRLHTIDIRRFSAVLSCIALVITLVSVPSTSQGQGYINVEMSYGSYTKTTQLISDVVTARSNNYSSFGEFNAIANGSTVNITNIFRSGSAGQSIYFTLAITNSTPFTLSQISMTSTDAYTSLSGTFADFGITYSGQGIGIGVDGTVYTSGNANTPVYAVYLIGLGSTIDITGQSVSDAQASWVAGCPFTTVTSYSLGSLTSSAQITFIDPVPEPVLNIYATNNNRFVLAWPLTTLSLQQNSNLTSTNWLTITNTPTVVGNQNQLVVTNAGNGMFYRLKQ